MYNETASDRHLFLSLSRFQNTLNYLAAKDPAEYRPQVHMCFSWHSLSPQVTCLQSNREGKEILYKDAAILDEMKCDKICVILPSKQLSLHIMHIKQISSHVVLLLYNNIMCRNCGGISDVLYNWKHGFIIFVGIYSILHKASAATCASAAFPDEMRMRD